MVIVSDTSSISNLIQIGQLQLLRELYEAVTITPAVKKELYRIENHAQVIEDLEWIKIVAPSNKKMVHDLSESLDLGESESIALAIEKSTEYLIIDEYLGRKIAQELKLKVIGVLGILISAKEKGIIVEVKTHIEKLQKVGFRLNPELVKTVLFKTKEI